MIYDILYWIFLYIFCTSILPVILMLGNNLFASLCFYTYKSLNKNDPSLIGNPREFWRRPYTLLTKYWLLYGRVLHGKISILPILLRACIFLKKLVNIKKFERLRDSQYWKCAKWRTRAAHNVSCFIAYRCRFFHRKILYWNKTQNTCHCRQNNTNNTGWENKSDDERWEIYLICLLQLIKFKVIRRFSRQ